jgi:outer membrane protein OmpA-like peptidoglycan-associated protein/tetratricopeptide (TPR) repeat protein
MSVKTNLIIFFACSFFLVDLASQEEIPPRLYAEANEWIISEEYNEALPLLLNILYSGYDNPNIQYKIGYCYLNIPGKKNLAIPYLQRAVKSMTRFYEPTDFDNIRAPIEAMFLLGKANRLKYYLDDAIEAYQKYLDLLSPRDSLNIARVNREIIKCENAMDLYSQPIELEMTNLGGIINTPFNNFNPVGVQDGDEIFYMNQLKFYDAVFHSTLSGKSWSAPENLTNKIRSDGEYYLTGISGSGHELVLSTYNMLRKADLYYTAFNGSKWNKLEAIPEPVNSPFVEDHGSFSPDGKALYFTSNRGGGFGGMDIYVSYRDSNNNWSEPMNLGSQVNTPFDEATPFCVKQGQETFLYFSSLGHYNMGGYDIFKSEKNPDGTWSQPKNLGYPLNTTDDDLFFYPTGIGEGYMSRYNEQGGYGKFDIFQVKILSEPSPRKVSIRGEMDRSGKWKEGVIELLEVNNEEKTPLKKTSLNHRGEYFFRVNEGDYIIQVQSPDDTLSAEISITGNYPFSEIINPIYAGNLNETTTSPDPVLGEETIEDTLVTKYFVLFEFDSSVPTGKDKDRLDSLRRELGTKEFHYLHVHGRSDDIGDARYNLFLSKSRAEHVLHYLSMNNFPPSRIKLKYYGETSPLVRNVKNVRKWNRSAEIMIFHPVTTEFMTMQNQLPDKYIIK